MKRTEDLRRLIVHALVDDEFAVALMQNGDCRMAVFWAHGSCPVIIEIAINPTKNAKIKSAALNPRRKMNC